MMLDREKIKELAAIKSDQCVTIYIPTHKAGMEVNAGHDVIAYKNELQSIHSKLKQQGYEEQYIDEFMKCMFGLLKNDAFWKHQLDGLVVFRNEEVFNFHRVPVEGTAISHISSRFLITPLLPLLTTDMEYYLLAIGNKKVRLYRCTKTSIKEIEIPDLVPESLEHVISAYDPEKKVLERTNRINYDGPLDTDYLPEGLGNGHSGRERFEFEYYRDISNSIAALDKSKHALLVIAGLEEHLKTFKEANAFPHLLEESIHLNPERFDQQQLHEQAAAIVQKYTGSAIQKQIERYHTLAGTGKTSYELATLLLDAFGGRVDTLFVEKNRQVWGTFDENTFEVVLKEEQDTQSLCLLNLAASYVLLNSGNVYMLEREQMPETLDSGAIAIYRY